MPRSRRLLLAGGYFHVVNRGNDRSVVFRQPTDFSAFLRLIEAAQERIRLRLLAYCLMPNHFHLVLSPDGPDDVSRWMHWLTTTHAHRHHLRFGTSGCVWQGRFKSFRIKHDAHLLTVMRYVERNALRSGLVEKAEQWSWGSLALRMKNGDGPMLSEPPVPLPRDWASRVNEPHAPAELEVLRRCVNRQRPFGDEQWMADTMHRSAPAMPARGRGRPRQAPSEK
jgi:putative transposase